MFKQQSEPIAQLLIKPMKEHIDISRLERISYRAQANFSVFSMPLARSCFVIGPPPEIVTM